LYTQQALFLLLLFLASCGSKTILVQDLDTWQTLNDEQKQQVLLEIESNKSSELSLRHRINLITPIEKRSFEQIFVSKDEQMSLSFFSPAYIKLLYRLVDGISSDILIDYQSQYVYQLEEMNSISLGELTLSGVGKVYPEVVRGKLSANTIMEAKANKNHVLKRSPDGKSFYLKLEHSAYSVEYRIVKSDANILCLHELYVKTNSNDSGVIYRGDEVSGTDCVPTKISIIPDSSSAKLEAVLLIKQNKVQLEPNPFSTEIPSGFQVK
jgi:hypothetical protein